MTDQSERNFSVTMLDALLDLGGPKGGHCEYRQTSDRCRLRCSDAPCGVIAGEVKWDATDIGGGQEGGETRRH
jgi:hypothetical protein